MKNEKLWPKQRRQNSAETDNGSSYNQEKWLEKLLDDKGAFYNGSESDDGDNDENYRNHNEQQQLSEVFSNNCYKVVSLIPLQELIDDQHFGLL